MRRMMEENHNVALSQHVVPQQARQSKFDLAPGKIFAASISENSGRNNIQLASPGRGLEPCPAFQTGRRKVQEGEAMLEIEKGKEKNEQCSTCGTGFVVRVCSNCAVGCDAWNIWFRTVAPSELKDHTGRISVENKRLIDGILNAEFGG